MAIENVPINTGTGPRIAVDTVGTDNYQVVKFSTAADGTGGGLFTGTVFTIPVVATAIVNGRSLVAADTVATQLAASASCQHIIITALVTNTAEVWIGGSGVNAVADSETGIPLVQGQSWGFAVNDVGGVYVNALNSNDGVAYAYFV